MKIRFIVAIPVILLFFSLGIMMAGNPLYLYADLLSLVFAIFIPHIILSFRTPLSIQRKIIHELLSDEADTSSTALSKGISYLRSLKTMIMSCSLAAFLSGVIGMMANLEYIADLGPNTAVLLIAAFYAALYILTVIEPLRLAAEMKITELEK